MAEPRVAKAPVAASDGNLANPRTNAAQELLVPDYYLELAMQGRIFSAGDGIESTKNDSLAALADITPSYILKAPSGNGGVAILPLEFVFELETEGGAEPALQVAYVMKDVAITTAGTPLVALNHYNDPNGVRGSVAICQLNPTVGVIVSAAGIAGNENVVMASALNLVDNLITVETIVTGAAAGGAIQGDLSNSLTLRWRPVAPVPMVNGSMMHINLYTGTTDSKWRVQFTWAEVPTTGR